MSSNKNEKYTKPEEDIKKNNENYTFEMIYKPDEGTEKIEESTIFEMIYKLNNNKTEKIKEFNEKFINVLEEEKEYSEELRILGKYFVKHNGNKTKLIYNNKKYKLKEYFKEIEDNYEDKDIVKLKIKGINNITDISRIFYGCYHLSKVTEYQQKNNLLIEEIKESSLTKSPIKSNINIQSKFSIFSIESSSTLKSNKIYNLGQMFFGCISLE